MATYRPFQCAFWRDDFVRGLTPEDRYFYIYLFTNEAVTTCGIYQLNKQVMVYDTGYNLETIDKLIARFVEYGKIDYSEETSEICLINFIQNNYFSKKGISDLTKKGIINSLNRVINKNLINQLKGLKDIGITLDIPLNKPLTKSLDIPLNNTLAYNNITDNNITNNSVTNNSVTSNSVTSNSVTSNSVTSNSVTDNKTTDFKTIKSVIEQKSRIVTSTPDGLKQEQVTGNRRKLDMEYEELFEIYPKKTHHDTGFNAYINANALGQLPPFQQLKQAIEEQKHSQQWQNITYVPSIANWIRQARWKDVLVSDIDPKQTEHQKKIDDLTTWALANGYKESEIFLSATTAAYKNAMGLA